jgi:glycosyltransferase involved in cell wall biosynthesis
LGDIGTGDALQCHFPERGQVITMAEGNKPVFSIVMPTYNRASILRQAIQCVLDQTFTDFELIVIDDASSDETEGCVNSFSDSRVHYLRHNTNKGVSAARNTGVRRSQGGLVMFLDDDDESFPNLLAATFNAFNTESEAVGFAWSGIRRVATVHGNEVILKERSWPRESKYSQPLTYLSVGTGYGLTVRSDCFERIGLFDETLRSCVDLDLLIRLGNTFDFTIVPEILVKVYRRRGKQLTDVTQQRVNSLERVVQKNSQILEKNLDAWTQVYDRLAVMHYRLGNKQRGRELFLKMISKRPLEYSIWRQFIRRETFSAKSVIKRHLAHGKVLMGS